MEYMSGLGNGFDEYKPSLFEILAENQLAGLIPPSLRYLLTVATYRRPRYLLSVLNSFDEIHALLTLLLERHFLKTYGGSFTEHFYGLKREKIPSIKGGEVPRAQAATPDLVREALQLKERDIWANLTVLIGIPYLKRKLDQSYDIHVPQTAILGPRFNHDTLPPSPTLRQRILYYYKWFLRKVYPSLNAAYCFALLAFNLAYLFDHTKFSSPFLFLLNTRLRRLSIADYRAIAKAEAAGSAQPTSPARPGQGTSILHPSMLGKTALGSLKLLLPTSIFALKFLEWYHASDFARQLSKKATDGLDLPPPVISGLPKPAATGSPLQSSSSPLQQQRQQQQRGMINAAPTAATNTVALAQTASPSPVPPPALPSHEQQPPTSSAPPHRPPISSTTGLPIFTVPALILTQTPMAPSSTHPPAPSPSAHCPICLTSPPVTPTATATGYVYCYVCIFRWVEGEHERQIKFMEGGVDGGRTGGVEDTPEKQKQQLSALEEKEDKGRTSLSSSRVGVWDSGKGRDPVTGRRLLGGREGLRRVMA